MNHYGLDYLGLDTGAPATANVANALQTYDFNTTAGVAVQTGAGVSTPFGGANISGRISTTMLAAVVVGLVVFYVKTRGNQL